MKVGFNFSREPISIYSKNNNVQREFMNESVFGIEQAVVDAQESSVVKQDSSIIYQELSSQYDVKSATFEELIDISTALYDAGEITLAEHALLTFDNGRAANDLKRFAQGVPSDFSLYETTADSYGRRDWLAEFEARASKNFLHGNIIGYQGNQNALSILERLLRE